MANLTRYKLVHSPAGYSDFIRMCDNGECGEYVKFEEAMEASSNSLQQLKAEIALKVGSIARDSSIPAVDRLDRIVVLVNEQLSAV